MDVGANGGNNLDSEPISDDQADLPAQQSSVLRG